MPSSPTDGETTICSRCNFVRPLEYSFEGSGNCVLILPCGCPWHRGCLKEMFGIEKDNGSECVNCHFQIFQEWSVYLWMDTLERKPLSAVSSGEVYPECAICKTHYRRVPEKASEGEPERPVMLPCKHILGEDCLEKWLSPHRGASNSCPICRKKLFSPRPSPRKLLLAGAGDATGHGLQQRQEVDDEVAEARRLQERLYWDRFMLGHQQLQRLSTTDAAADREFLNQQLDDVEMDYREWVFEPRWQLNQRRERIKALLLSRVIERARTRREILRLERYGES